MKNFVVAEGLKRHIVEMHAPLELTGARESCRIIESGMKGDASRT